MLATFLSCLVGQLLYWALHLESGSFPRPLTQREEAEAFAALHAGDPDARDRLIRHNLRLVAHIVKKYYSGSGDHEDLISIGTIGLIKAVGSFDERKGARFATYAARCIENEVLMYFRAGKKNQNVVSIQEPIDQDREGNDLTLNDVVTDGCALEERYESREETGKLRRAVEALEGRERQIILLRYGLSGAKPLTQQQVAELLHISRSYISRLESRAVQRLRTLLEEGEKEPPQPAKKNR